MTIRSIKEAQVDGKTVFVRVDFNIPMRNGLISDDSRIIAALPTLNLLRHNGARLIIASHLGRPAGKVIDDLRLEPVRIRLSELLKVNVTSAGGPSGSLPAKTLAKNDKTANRQRAHASPGLLLRHTLIVRRLTDCF